MPNLDCLIGEDMRFTNCIKTSLVCVPARLSLATELYPHQIGMWKKQPSQPRPEPPIWIQRMRAASYCNSLFDKTHLHPRQSDLRECEGLTNAYGLGDIGEMGDPRASTRVLSHMVAARREASVW